MKIVVGLGNPKEEYASTRHNVGFMLVDKLSSLDLPKIKLLKSTLFMNESGKFVKRVMTKNPSDLVIIHDDLDIPLGSYKIQKGKGPKLHNGILSIEREIGTDDFWRVRIGIDNRSKESRMGGEKYVLQNFTENEMQALEEVFDRISHESIFKG